MRPFVKEKKRKKRRKKEEEEENRRAEVGQKEEGAEAEQV